MVRERLWDVHGRHARGAVRPGLGGITYKSFWNSYGTGPGQFTDTNNLSLVVFIKYGNFKMLFPGDMERAGWLELLKLGDFRAELVGTDVLMAPHHGRYNGYCEEIFAYFDDPKLAALPNDS